MKEIKTKDAIGHILAHDITQIITGVTKNVRFKKGHIVTQEDIPVLLSLGKENLYVWEAQKDFLHEDEAAQILRQACMGKNLASSDTKEGKIELSAQINGVFVVDKQRLYKLNSIGNIAIATISNFMNVSTGTKVAGMKIIPLTIAQQKMNAVLSIANEENPILSIKPYKLKKAALLITGNEVKTGLIKDTFAPVIENKLAFYGVSVTEKIFTGDDENFITQSIHAVIANGCEIVICTGGMSVDPDDKTPGAIKASGSKIISYGMPIMPGVMMLLSYLNNIPILGLPGCAMYDNITVFDVLLPRLLANIPISQQDILSLSDGGFCHRCKTCTWPICAYGK
ncbi:MAG: molybdopterin-binding protein [Treponemataceae bacterium]